MSVVIDFLILSDDSGGAARLTNQSTSSRYGVPVLQVSAEDIDGDFGPADLIDFTSIGRGIEPAANIVAAWARDPQRTADELEAARLFLQQWPEGPQI